MASTDRRTVVFTVIAYWVVKNAQIGSFVPTVVALSLPLSAMWAAVNTSNFHIANEPRAAALPYSRFMNYWATDLAEEVRTLEEYKVDRTEVEVQ